MPDLPSFKDGICGELCFSILSLAKVSEWGKTLEHSKQLHGLIQTTHYFSLMVVCYVDLKCVMQ